MLKTYLFPFLLSIGFCVGLGFWDYLSEIKDAPLFFVLVLSSTFFFIAVKQLHSSIFKYIFLALFFVISLYIASGTGFLQGHMSLGIVASIFQSNTNEAFEFLSVVDPKYIVFAFVIFLSLCFYILFFNQANQGNYPKLILALIFIANGVSVFGVQTALATVKYKQEEAKLLEDNLQDIDWQIQQVNASYDNQVIIIGESVQRDHLSLYGSKDDTTPFLNEMPLDVVDHYIATAPNTVTSLTRTLTLVDQNREPQIAKNVVTLAKQAGYNTIWISNQGFMGKNDTAISKIAIHADHQFFLKSGNYMSSNIDDDKMVEILQAQLKKYANQKNVIFIHMMGSHPDACERLFKAPRMYANKPETINCYLSSINKLDHFIEQIYTSLKADQRSFSVTYFSDHGMTVDEDSYHVDNEFKDNYQVPFFVLRSDAQAKNHYNKTVSAYDYMHIYADLLGVKTPLLDPKKSLANIEDNQNVTVFDWDDYVPYKKLNESEAQ